MTNFPTTLDDSTSIPAESASTPLSTNHVTSHQNIQDAIEAIEAKIGVNSSAVTTSHDYKLSEVTSTDKAVGKTATQTLTNKTLTAPVLTSPTLNLGSDAEGDTYYRNSSGALVRLARGTDNYIYKMNGNVPNWEAETVVVAATESVEGISRLATAAQITAGTASEASYPLVVTPDQLALATPVFNGSGLTNLSGSNISDFEFYSGVGIATATKTYHHFNLPWILSTDVPSGNFWTIVGATYTSSWGSVKIQASGDATASAITTNGIGTTISSGSANDLTFATGKDVICEFTMQRAAVATEQMGWGLATTTAPFIDFDDASQDAACFTVDTSGNLYGHTSNGDGTTNHTETSITGVTLTSNNTYRIHFNPGVDVKFYVNGVLKATNTTHLPSAGTIKFGNGVQGNTNDNDRAITSSVWFAIEK